MSRKGGVIDRLKKDNIYFADFINGYEEMIDGLSNVIEHHGKFRFSILPDESCLFDNVCQAIIKNTEIVNSPNTNVLNNSIDFDKWCLYAKSINQNILNHFNDVYHDEVFMRNIITLYPEVIATVVKHVHRLNDTQYMIDCARRVLIMIART
jgi:hypothetical protein